MGVYSTPHFQTRPKYPILYHFVDYYIPIFSLVDVLFLVFFVVTVGSTFQNPKNSPTALPEVDVTDDYYSEMLEVLKKAAAMEFGGS